MPRFDKDYYKLLGVLETASPEEIRKTYRAKAKECHPDRAGGDKTKEVRFKEINEAHEVLSDPPRRAQYDRMRKSGFSGDPSDFLRQAQGGGARDVRMEDLGDLFSSFIDMDAWGRQAGGRARRQRGEDTAFSLEIPFELAARGGRTTITLPKEEPCEVCKGTGGKGAAKPCARCRGTGVDSRAQGGFAFNRPCAACLGRGVQPGPACPACQGEGTRHVERQIEVKIPAGVTTGSKLRLAGEGAPGLNGGPPGDCLLELTVASHPDFEREGRDVTGTVEVDFADAILGAELTAQTLGGPVKLKIPPGTQPGARLRLAGQGIQGPDGEPGDHYVRVKVRLPRKLTEEQKKALEAFR
jgi:molecular chaperone DnaJ